MLAIAVPSVVTKHMHVRRSVEVLLATPAITITSMLMYNVHIIVRNAVHVILLHL
jgi:hypothetical protein